MVLKVIDRDTGRTTEASKGGTRHLTIPISLAKVMKIEPRVELRIVQDEETGELSLLVSNFRP